MRWVPRLKPAFERVGLLKRRLLIWRMAFINRVASSSILGDGVAVVAITSFGKRVELAGLAIESIAMGELKPKSVVLFLEDGIRDASLPSSIKRLIARGLKITYVPDYKSHKKYYFALRDCINDNTPLITIDDDFIYPKWFLKKMLNSYEQDRNCVFCYRAKEVAINDQRLFEPYIDWPFATVRTPCNRIFFTSGGGALLPICLLEELEREGGRFLQVCPRADDVWLNYVAAKSGIKSRLVLENSIDFTPLETPAEESLWTDNEAGGNDRQLRTTYDAEVLDRIAAGR